MADRDQADDPRVRADRYRAGRGTDGDDAETDAAGQRTMEQHVQHVRIAIEQAERRGDFDDLPGAGKPIVDLHRPNDPDWWIRRKIEREKLTGLGPPALTLRTEDAQLDARMDAATSERAVRELLVDFNRRVIDARRQLQGGPPVITAPRDIDDEVNRWRDRRAERDRSARETREREDAALAAMTWRERRRAKRSG